MGCVQLARESLVSSIPEYLSFPCRVSHLLRFNFLGSRSSCADLVRTILITVLTNSFMAIASNANEEHQ